MMPQCARAPPTPAAARHAPGFTECHAVACSHRSPMCAPAWQTAQQHRVECTRCCGGRELRAMVAQECGHKPAQRAPLWCVSGWPSFVPRVCVRVSVLCSKIGIPHTTCPEKSPSRLTQHHVFLVQELVLGHLQIQRCGAPSDAPRAVVMRAVAARHTRMCVCVRYERCACPRKRARDVRTRGSTSRCSRPH